MTLKIPISPEIERRLREEAARLGVDEAEFARRLIEQNLPPVALPPDQATVDLLAEWDAQDATSDPTEIARRQRQWDEFRKSMNENSLSGRLVYP